MSKKAIGLSLALVLSVFAGVVVTGSVADAKLEDSSVQQTVQPQDSTVTIKNQTSGGESITIESVSLPEGGFVTIHDASLSNGKTLESVRGSSSYLKPGTHQNVKIHLNDPLEEDTTVVAMPHKDTDGDRKYEFVSGNANEDGPYTSGGNIVIDTAKIKVSATVGFSDQKTEGSTIVLDSVSLSEPGFVAVHDTSLKDGKVLESVVGHSKYLEAGTYKNVRVELDETLSSDQTLIPMPHKDSDDDTQYDFVRTEGGEDGPFINHLGKPVVDTGMVKVSNTASANITKQSTGGNWVTVDRVFVPEGGFVTIHDASLNNGKVFESVRGTSKYLGPGLHRNVRVNLNKPLSSDGTLVAMPHKDTDNDQSYGFVNTEGKEDGPYTAEGSIVVNTAEVKVSASISFEWQKSDGRTITVESVDLSEGGFIAVHDSTLLNGKVLESVAGHSKYLEAGRHKNVKITLDKRLTETQTLIPMPHKDSNGDQKYTFVESEGKSDGPYINTGGGAVIDTAQVSIQSSIEFTDQKTQDGSVTIDSVTLSDGGFVVIHDASLKDGKVLESVIGVSEYLGPGTHENVEISLDESLEGEKTLISMPHKDTNSNKAYDFVDSEGGEDGPYVAQGAVIDPAKVMGGEDKMEDSEMEDGDNNNSEMEDNGSDDGMDNEDMSDNKDMENNNESSMNTGDGSDNMSEGDEMNEDGSSGNDSSDGSGSSLPGFGLVVAFVAVIAVAVIAFRRR